MLLELPLVAFVRNLGGAAASEGLRRSTGALIRAVHLAARGVAAVGAVAAAACASAPTELPPWMPVADPHKDSVQAVLFFVGDAGLATDRNSPLLIRLSRDVEEWTAGIPTDSSVAVIFLGDNVYPEGIRTHDDAGFAADSAALYSQAAVVAGPVARLRGARGIFIAGNHDWGNMPGAPGAERLRNEERHLAALRSSFVNVMLLPEAGTGGPGVLDIGHSLRLILLDTAWWIFEKRNAHKMEVIRGVEQALRGRNGRDVVIAAHHPWQSGGVHGGLVPFWKAFGVRFLLNRSGAIVQDMSSVAYRLLHDSLDEMFGRLGPPVLFAGGHEHSLQVFSGVHAGDPAWSMTAGSGSKLTDVGYADGQRFRLSAPGYVRVVFLWSGEIRAYVIAGDPDFLLCDEGADSVRADCIRQGLQTFRTAYSVRLK